MAIPMTAKTPLRDLLVTMTEDAAEYRRPDPADFCGACRDAPEDRCDDCANEQAQADDYECLRKVLRAAGSDTEALTLLGRHAALLAAEMSGAAA